MQSVRNASSLDHIDQDNSWTSSQKPELLMHSIHSYPAKFPALIANQAIEYAQIEEVTIKTIADVFCGCGTVPLEAKVHGYNFWGTDINPVATLIARVKSNDYDPKKLKEYKEKIFFQVDSDTIKAHDFSSANERIQYWFTKKSYTDLDILLRAIRATIKNDECYLDAFLCIFSSILKASSKWLMKSIKPQIDQEKQEHDVMKLFQRNFNRFLEATKQINSQLLLCNQSRISPTIDIEQANFLTKETPPRVDLIVSSPPYVTSYEYADLHQLSSLWLGYTDDYRSLREGSVGSSYGCASLNADVQKLNSIAEEIISQLKAAKVTPSKIRAISRYYIDMQAAVKKCYRMLNDKGMILFVIGDTEYKGVPVTNAKHLVKAMDEAGFEDIKACKRTISQKLLTPYRDQAGRFTTSDKRMRSIYHEEFVISARRPAA